MPLKYVRIGMEHIHLDQSWSQSGKKMEPKKYFVVVLGELKFPADIMSDRLVGSKIQWILSKIILVSVRLLLIKVNDSPTDLNTTAALAFQENQPVGTVIGEFNATDPDANATLSYALIDGNGSIDNQLFTLEQNGTLKTVVIFDYENNQSNYSIRVQVKDEYNASLEKAFFVELQNINENPVIHSANIGNNGPTCLA